MLVIFLFAIDATIVSTSMPTIVARLGGLELYSWVFSIYMLTSALTTPLFGKLADLFSHRRLMLIGIGIFVLGSTLCGAAQSMEMLVLFRAIQGLGGGAIYALAFIVVGVLFPPEQRAKMQGIISSIWGISSILGPLAGGLIVEHTSWRWVFFVNLQITDPRHPEHVMLENVEANEQLVEMRGDDVLERHEPVGPDGQKSRQQRRHLYPSEDRLTGFGVGDGDRQAERQPRDERERVRRIDRQRPPV